MRLNFFFVILFSSLIYVNYLFYNKNSLKCWNNINFKKIEESLRYYPIKGKTPMKKYNTGEKPDIFLVSFDNGLKAVFKPNRNIIEQASTLRAYFLSQLLKFHLVPPTVIRTIDQERGILQLFIEGKIGYKYDLENLSPHYKDNIYFFNFLIGSFDSDPDDTIVGKNCKTPALIDSDGNMVLFSLIEYGDFPYLRMPILGLKNITSLKKENFEKFPFDQFNTIKNISSVRTEKLRKIFFNIKRNNYIDLFDEPFHPNDLIDDTLYYIKWKNAYWIKYNSSELKYIYKDFVPTSISQKTIQQLKQLNRSNLALFSPIIKEYFDEKDSLFVLKNIKTIDNLLLYKKEILLENFDQ